MNYGHESLSAQTTAQGLQATSRQEVEPQQGQQLPGKAVFDPVHAGFAQRK